MICYQGPIKLVLFDVDGVLTDGSLHFTREGEAIKTFNVRDGLAIGLLRVHGVRCGVLSGKTSAPLDQRIQQLQFDLAITGKMDKRDAYEVIKHEEGLDNSQIAYIGDDVVDFPLIGQVGIFYAPGDAHELIRVGADHVLKASGGRGAARELAEHLLQSGGLSLAEVYQPLIDSLGDNNVVQ